MFGKNNGNKPLPGSNTAPVTSNDIIERLAVDYMRDRKWRRIFKFALLALLLFYVVGVFFIGSKGASKLGAHSGLPHTALVELDGVIGGQGGVWADQINQSLRSAFKSNQAKAVVLRINSPGGSPVQSDEINAEITRLRKKYPNKPLYAVVSDVCASGGYYVAVAADQIYANPSSIVGSIGVRMDGFGFVDAMKKYGVERRSLTAGENKAILDPFLPVNPAQEAHAKKMLDVVHQEFIDVVKRGRGDRLKESPGLFSGLFWSGRQAKKLGLIDEFGSLGYVAREVVGEENIVDYSYRPDFFEQFSRELGVSIGTSLAEVFDDRLELK